MEALEVLYDHYKETFSLSKEAQSRRNKSFIVLCILEAISFFVLLRPEKAFEIIIKGINNELNTALQLSNTIIQTLLWVLIAYVMIRYVQDMLYIERQYIYLEQLERKISKCELLEIFNREGGHYKNNFPMVINFIDLFYKMLMPIFFMALNIVRISKEWVLLDKMTVALVCDTILFAVIFIITWFYFFEIHTKITEFCKKHIPFVGTIAKKLRKLLKEV